MNSAPSPQAKALLNWYDKHARPMPWRIPPDQRKTGVLPNPYHVWLSEIMLQQTQVATVRDYFLKFVSLWPDVQALANTDTEEVMKAWAGLGYYSRARNLKKCAEVVSKNFGGTFPKTAGELKKLPGIGDYTSAAIASIAFDEPIAVVDGNVERVFSRLFEIDEPNPKLKEITRERAQSLLDVKRPGDFAQASMDLGATICTPRNPACILCPLSAFCAASKAGTQETYPKKVRKAHKPTRKGAAFVMQHENGSVWLEKRAETGLLGAMTQVPTTDWNSRQDGATGETAAPLDAEWQLRGTARHTFTHFHLELEVWLSIHNGSLENGWWSAPDALPGEALPTVMKKVIETALPNATRPKRKSAQE